MEDNHDIIKLSREALQDSPAAAYCGGCCVTTPNAFYSFVLGDSDNSFFEITLLRTIIYLAFLSICRFFLLNFTDTIISCQSITFTVEIYKSHF